MRIVLATGNAGKLRELQAVLQFRDVEVVPQSQFTAVSAEETGLSFVENAILKARHAARASGLPAVADDSGIEVDELHGAPGIYSARYAGPHATDQENLDKLLHAMWDVPASRSHRLPGGVGRPADRHAAWLGRFRLRPDLRTAGSRADGRRTVAARKESHQPSGAGTA
jgi:non-canonical purine NTP pyrophosphatase (RdgB/HAM1 family)